MDPNQDRAVQAAFDGYVPASELREAKAEIERLRARIEYHTANHNREICECPDCQVLRGLEQKAPTGEFACPKCGTVGILLGAMCLEGTCPMKRSNVP